MKVYEAAAEVWKANKAENPDGWYTDPEADCGLEEAMYEAQMSGNDPLEVARSSWKFYQGRFMSTGHASFAGAMVATELVAAKWRS